MPDSSAIDAALITKLSGDSTLLGYMPNGVYLDEATANMTRFVIVSLVDEVDEPVFGGRAIEDALYLVKAVEKSTSPVNAKAAAARIDALLEDQPLTVAGYTWMTTHREARITPMVEVDEIDTSIRWQHRGGYYRVQCSL